MLTDSHVFFFGHAALKYLSDGCSDGRPCRFFGPAALKYLSDGYVDGCPCVVFGHAAIKYWIDGLFDGCPCRSSLHPIQSIIHCGCTIALAEFTSWQDLLLRLIFVCVFV